jgi:sec-independent protein translocase protein TatA
LAVFGGLGVWEVLLLFLIVLLLFGAPRIPQIARGLGEGIRNFKSGVKEPEQLSEGDGDGGSDSDTSA